MKEIPGNIQNLVDFYNREIDYLRISITDRCNMRCIYCMPEKGIEHCRTAELLTCDEIVRFVSIARRFGVKKVRLTGGEPLLRKDILLLIAGLKAAGIPDLSITTNGTRLASMAVSLKRAGLDRINISLDTLKAGMYRTMTRGGDIKKVWEAIHEAERAGLYPIKINVVPVKGMNDDEIEEFASLTFVKDYHIRFIEMMPFGCSREAGNKLMVGKDELMKKVSRIGTLLPLEYRGKGPSRNYRIDGARGIIGFISPVTECFCHVCNRLRLTALGRIRPCLCSDVEIDIKTPMRYGITDHELEKLIWRAVAVKPSGNYLGRAKEFSPGIASLSQIGG